MTVRIGFIGCGRMGSAHAGALVHVGGSEIVGVYDIDMPKARDFIKQFNGRKVCRSRAELLDMKPDVVLICDYGHQHAEELHAVMDAGIRCVFCEKPVIRQFGEAAPLLEKAKKTGCMVCVGHVRRCWGAQVKMKEIIDSGILGRILFAKAHFCTSTFSREWGSYFADYSQSGGVTLDMGIHYIDLFNWYFGRPEKASGVVLGMENALSESEKPCDYFCGGIRYAGGVVCGLEASYQRHGEPSELIEVYGTENTLLCDSKGLRVCGRDTRTEYTVKESNPLETQMSALLKMASGKVPCPCMLEDGILAAETGLAIMASGDISPNVSFLKGV